MGEEKKRFLLPIPNSQESLHARLREMSLLSIRELLPLEYLNEKVQYLECLKQFAGNRRKCVNFYVLKNEKQKFKVIIIDHKERIRTINQR
jgi:hypothetical protein